LDIKLLHGIPLFACLSEEETQVIASQIELQRVTKGTTVMTEGDETNSLYIILSGKVKIFLNDEAGEEIILNYLGEGDYFGEISLFDGGGRSASVIAREDSYFAVLEQRDFVRLLSTHPELAVTMIRGASQRMRSLSDNVRSLAANW
jgi:CRP/FNR family cyclic AMP-dependent transcriptional regulator